MYHSALTIPGQNLEQRSAPRRELTLRLPARRGERLLELVVHDISHTGFLAEAPAGLSVQDDLLVELPELCTSEARVVWQSGDFVGCNFTRPIPRSILSAALLRGDAKPPAHAAPPPLHPNPHPVSDDRLPLRTRAWVLVACAVIPWASIGSAILLI